VHSKMVLDMESISSGDRRSKARFSPASRWSVRMNSFDLSIFQSSTAKRAPAISSYLSSAEGKNPNHFHSLIPTNFSLIATMFADRPLIRRRYTDHDLAFPKEAFQHQIVFPQSLESNSETSKTGLKKGPRFRNQLNRKSRRTA